uniref:Uncharacterized protein n=1 Tax=Oryzias melastigma TaxID=30732 RepID=A0A3B3DLL8_ORYME
MILKILQKKKKKEKKLVLLCLKPANGTHLDISKYKSACHWFLQTKVKVLESSPELKQAVQKIKNYINKRLQALIEAKGGNTRY